MWLGVWVHDEEIEKYLLGLLTASGHIFGFDCRLTADPLDRSLESHGTGGVSLSSGGGHRAKREACLRAGGLRASDLPFLRTINN